MSVLWGMFNIDKEAMSLQVILKANFVTAIPQMLIFIEVTILYIIISMLRTRIFLAFLSIYTVYIDALNLSAVFVYIIDGSYFYAAFWAFMWVLLTTSIVCFTVAANHSILKHRSVKVQRQNKSEYLKYQFTLLKNVLIPGIISSFLYTILNSCIR
ncbi:hypothetical protein [Apilactobacillus kunkeei]|uniref:hypothetical protein n=1 Tax=Apilactobacillus kunkeei TaxID=148814 RepID=UPI0012D71FA7|nr:hypothetical protein [Apilactobacillus kunkeei]